MLNHSRAPLLNKLKNNKFQILCSDTKSFSDYSNSHLIFFLLKLSFKTVIKYIKQIHRIWSFSAMNIGHVGAGREEGRVRKKGEGAPFPSSPSSNLLVPPSRAKACICFSEPGAGHKPGFSHTLGPLRRPPPPKKN